MEGIIPYFAWKEKVGEVPPSALKFQLPAFCGASGARCGPEAWPFVVAKYFLHLNA